MFFALTTRPFLSRPSAPTEVIVLENTLDGIIFPQDEIMKISIFAREHGIKLHLDGARLWHVVAEKAIPIKDLCSPFDSVNMCFSKGLGAHFFHSSHIL
jgi:threonine aldolase